MSATQRRIVAVTTVKVRTTMQRLTRKVNRNGSARTVHADVYRKIRVLKVHDRSLPRALTQTITEGVLYLKSRKVAVSQLLVRPMRAHGNARTRNGDILPSNVAHACIQKIGIPCIHTPRHQ